MHQPLEGWAASSGGLYAQHCRVDFRICESPEASLVGDLLQRGGHFCRQGLQVEWSADTAVCAYIKEIEWLDVSVLDGLIPSQMCNPVGFQDIAFLPRDAFVHMSEETHVNANCPDGKVDKARAEDYYDASEWEHVENDKQFRVGYNGLRVQLTSDWICVRTSGEFETLMKAEKKGECYTEDGNAGDDADELME